MRSYTETKSTARSDEYAKYQIQFDEHVRRIDYDICKDS